MLSLTDNEIIELARRKAHAKLMTLDFELEDLKNDLKLGVISPITVEEHELLIRSCKREIPVWQWIEQRIYQ